MRTEFSGLSDESLALSKNHAGLGESASLISLSLNGSAEAADDPGYFFGLG